MSACACCMASRCALRARRLRRRRRAPTLRVSAAASLKNAFEDYGASFEDADVSFSFAGSDELAAQIRKGGAPGRVRGGEHQAPGRSSTTRAWWSSRSTSPRTGSWSPCRRTEARVPSLGDLDNARRADRGRLAERAGRLLHPRGARAAGRRSRPRRSSATSGPTSPTSRASSARSRRVPSTPASCTSTDVRASGGRLRGDRAAGPVQPQRLYGSRGREGHRSPRRGARRSSRACSTATAGRRSQRAGFETAGTMNRRHRTRPVPALLVAATAITLCFLTLPVAAIFVDVGPARADREPRRPGRGRRAAC